MDFGTEILFGRRAMLLPWKHVPCSALDLQVFEALIPPDHYLRRVKAILDFEKLRPILAECYPSPTGRPAVEPVLLLKLEFLEFHYNLSDRRVITQAQVNVAYRFFLDLSLDSELPHHTLLTYFRERLGAAQHQRLFDAVVSQAREHGLVKDRLRLKDATHLIANIAIPSTIQLVAQTRQQLLQAVRRYAPERVVSEEQKAQQIHDTTADLSGEERLLQRVVHLRSLVAWVEELSAQPPAADDAALAGALRLAHKVLADRAPTPRKTKADRVISVHDPDARTGMHGTWYHGYQLDVAMDADSEIITALEVQPANTDDSLTAAPLIAHEETVHGNDVKALSIDGVAFRGDVLRELTDPKTFNLEVFVPPRPEQPVGKFTSERFTLNADRTLTCPAGQTTGPWQRNHYDTGYQYRFPHTACAACALRAQCLDNPEQKTGRCVSKNDYEAEYRVARAKVETESYRQVRRQHRRIERKMADMVRWHGARRARYRGRPWVRLQGFLTGIVVNLKRMARLLGPPPVPVRAALAGDG
jgi:transposase